MKRKYLVVVGILSIMLNSCDTSNHQHDGHYFAVFNTFGLSFAKIDIDIRGNEVVVNNSVSGISKFNCKQFDDRIEYEENNGSVRVMYFLKNGDLKLNDNITLVKVENGSEKRKSDDLKKEREEDVNTKNTKERKNETVNHQYALIKDIVYGSKNEVIISLDYVQVKPIGEVNDFKVINENTAIRKFIVNKQCEILNCITNEKVNVDGLVDDRLQFISIAKKEKLIICDIKNNEIVWLNMGCYN